jgi:Ca2+-transporting ATPase
MEHKKHYTGLTNDQVLESRRIHGLNVLSPPKRDPLWKLFLEKFEDPIIRILLIAAFLSLGISFVKMEFAETIGIFCAILLATVVGFWFEMDANKKFDILNQVNDETKYKVIRNGFVCEIPKKEIVVGDIILLESGEEIPSDNILLEATSMQVDESCLTGESVPEDKTTNEAFFKVGARYASNCLMRGTKIMDGHCIAEVQKVGDATEFGIVAEESTEMTGEETPLNQQLDKLAKLIGVIGLGIAAFTFIARFLKDAIFGDVEYTFTQFGLVSAVIISALIMLIKVWLPIIYDGYELAGKDKEIPESVDKGSWLKWIGLGLLFFVVFVAIGIPFGVNPLAKESWISINTTGHILQYFMISVTLIVVAVPEGLPMSVTLSLALSMRKMLKSNNLVRKMHACETVGATTVICTDKTGTLTQNQMKVHKTDFFGLNGNPLSDDNISILIKEGIAVNSTAHLDISDLSNIKSLGNPTEAALLLWLHYNESNYLNLREGTQIIEQLTFSCERKYMATLVYSELLQKRVLYVKGAPEIVLSRCNNVLFDNVTKSVTETADYIENILTQYQKQAMRTIGFAYEIVDDENDRFLSGDIVNTNLTFIGITAISDPIRENVADAVKQCMKAGINVIMVTGDIAGTSKEIGSQIGIWNSASTDKHIKTGTDFESDIRALLVKYNIWTEEEKKVLPIIIKENKNLGIEKHDYFNDLIQIIDSNDEYFKELSQLKIICRARPTDKQRIVRLLQKSGEVVAVTGDGTNDAPALNYAHVGLSMGSGTSIAKEASDITLIDDSFKSITNAVLWGRTIFKNIQRFIIFQLTINVAALIIDFIGAIFWGKLPLTVTQLLWINLIMDTFAAGALASLPADVKVMKDKPRDRNSFIVTKDMAKSIFGVGLLFVILLLGMLYYFTVTDIFKTGDAGLDGGNKELTIFFSFFVFLQFWNMFNAKAFFSGKSAFFGLTKSVGFQIVALAIFLGQVLIVQFGGVVFRTTPLTLVQWLIIIGSTSFVLWIGELIRLIRR